MRITIELRRPARRSVALLLGVLLLTAPAVVLAGHQFADVPNGHQFHDEIGAIAGAGITTGFGDGGYHPGEPVTRQAMAAFMQRGLGRVGLATGSETMTSALLVPPGTDGTSYVPLRELTITVPGATGVFGPQQLVRLQGHIEFSTSMSTSGGEGCPCVFGAYIRDMITNEQSALHSQTFESSSSSALEYSWEVEGVFAAPPGPRTFRLEVALVYRVGSLGVAAFDLATVTSLSAMTFPFGPTGTSDL